MPSNRVTNVSLLYAINQTGIVAFGLKKGAYNASDFADFISNELKDKLDEGRNYHLIMDNCRIHKTKEVHEAVIGTNMNFRFLPPYSPQLNPIEEYFGVLKSKYKSIDHKPKTSNELMILLHDLILSNAIETSGFIRNSKKYIEKAIR